MDGIDILPEVFDSVTFDINLHNLMFYALTFALLIENLYQLIKPFFKKTLKHYELNGEEIQKEEIDYKHAIIPPVIGLVITSTFYPTWTYFSFMPFKPHWKFLELIYTAIIFGRIANAGHSASHRVNELALSLIGRIIGIKKY